MPNSIGERIKQRRKELGYNADYLANKLGVSRSTIFRYEKGDIEKVPVEIIAVLAEILQTTPEYLMGWSQTEKNVLKKTNKNIIKQKRKELGLSKKELAILLGTNESLITKWENGLVDDMKRDKILSLSKALNIQPNDILEITVDSFEETISSQIQEIVSELNTTRQKNVYSFASKQLEQQKHSTKQIINGRSTAAGSPLDGAFQDSQADTMVIDSIEIPNGADEMVTIAGDSMEPLLKKGQQVFIHYQPTIENGEIALLAIQDEGVTCKKVYFNDSNFTIVLESLNEKYEDMVYPSDAIRIIGKVIL